jgi:3-oxoacyl-[acyl-carrier-protein] synthase-3
MRDNIYIRSYVSFIPEKRISVDEIFAQLSDDATDGSSLTRFKADSHTESVAVFDTDPELGTALMRAAGEALEKADTAPEDISYIIFGNEHIAYTDLCSPVHTVRSELNLTRARILPVMHPCAAFLSALDLADKLLCGEENGNILYLSGCRWKSFGERYISFAMRGDGVGAAVISNTSGEFAVKGTNVMNLSNSLHDICGNKKTDEKISRFNLIVKGAAFLKESLGKFGVSAEDIVRVIQPNAGFTVYNELYPHFSGVGKEKFFFDNLADGGHICDIDIFRNLKSFTEAGTLKSGDRLVLYTPDIELSYDVNYYSALIEKT